MSAQSNHIQLINNLERDMTVLADPNLLNTVLRNLLSNAVKFSEEGGQVKVSGKKVEHDFVEVSIEDQGIGIAPEDIQKLFRIDMSTKTIGESTKKGTGFGLILCKEFIEKQGGQIQVESELHKGSIFKFRLPSC